MSQPWPPPPDLASIQELVRAADPQGFLRDGAPADEYDPEEREFFADIAELPPEELLTTTLLPILESIWTEAFSLDEESLAQIRPALLSLAKEVERFFGPDSTPRTRTHILTDNQA